MRTELPNRAWQSERPVRDLSRFCERSASRSASRSSRCRSRVLSPSSKPPTRRPWRSPSRVARSLLLDGGEFGLEVFERSLGRLRGALEVLRRRRPESSTDRARHRVAPRSRCCRRPSSGRHCSHTPCAPLVIARAPVAERPAVPMLSRLHAERPAARPAEREISQRGTWTGCRTPGRTLRALQVDAARCCYSCMRTLPEDIAHTTQRWRWDTNPVGLRAAGLMRPPQVSRLRVWFQRISPR